MSDLDFVPFDCDNHYYEAIDAFTRHLDPQLGPRCVQWCQINGRSYHVVGGMVSRAVTNPTFDPVSPAGAMHDYFRGNPDGKHPLEFLTQREPIRPEYRDRDARIATLNDHGLSAIWLFPTLGMLYEEVLRNDPEAVCHTFTAFNRWLEEDWGFAYQNRIFAAPYLSLADVDWACKELEWALDKGARVIVMRPAAPTTTTGPRSPSSTPVTAATRQTVTPTMPSRRGSAVAGSRRFVALRSSGPPPTSSSPRSSRSCSTGSRGSVWRRSKTVPTTSPTR
jgi:hypothetical protein